MKRNSGPVYGFVYRITRKADGKDYIGSKCFHTRAPLWGYYMSSSRTLSKEIKAAGIDYTDFFDFEMLFICGDRNSLVLAEAALQIEEDCIHNPDNYNRAIAAQRFIGPTEHTPGTKAKISKSVSEAFLGTGNPRCFDTYLGVSIETGETIEFTGNKELLEAGFSQGCVYGCIAGERKQHKGYRWFWKSQYNS